MQVKDPKHMQGHKGQIKDPIHMQDPVIILKVITLLVLNAIFEIGVTAAIRAERDECQS